VTTELVGRVEEIARIDAVLDRLWEGGGALVVRGEAGIGKSALLERARERADAAEALTLSAVGVESETELAFAGLHQLLLPIAASLPGPLEAAFGLDGRIEPDPFRVALAAYQLVCETADASPLVLVVDDAHWLDRSSLDVLTFIARRLEHEPIALVVAVRDGFATTLDEARLPALHLDGLDDGASAELLDRAAPGLSPVVRTRVLAEADGNPLGLVELAHAAPLDGSLAAAPTTLTARLEHAFAARLDGLDAPTRRALLAAALDSRATLDEVLSAAGDVPVTALDPAVAVGVVEVAGTRVQFRHPLVRSAVQQVASPAEVLAMYAALAGVVDDPERRLWHRAMAVVGPDEEVASALDAHARAARRRGAVMVAAAALERSAMLTADPHDKGERLVRAAELALDLGFVDVARRLLAQAEPLELGPLESARLAWMQQMLGGDVWFETGATKTFVAIADAMREGGDADMALRSLVPIALRCWWTRPRMRTREYLVAAAERVSVPDDDPRLLAVIALAHPEATGPTVRKRTSGTKLHDVADPVAAMHLGLAAGAAGNYPTGLPFLARAVERLREQGRLGMLTQALVHYGFGAIITGEWGRAEAAGTEAGRLARDSRQPQFGLTGALIAAHAGALRGTDADLDAMLAKPERALLAMKSPTMLGPARQARAAAALGEGRDEDAFAHLWPVFDEGDPGFHRFIRWWAVLDLVEAGARSGHEAQVATVVDELESIAERSAPPILVAGLACARPLLAAGDDAEPLYASALELELAGYPFLRARTLLSYGEWLRRRRRVADSRVPLRGAGELFDALGATRWSERARQELRATGERIGPRSPEARDRLTAQELQIAQLAAEGLTNREIGERLFLSHRTIGSHLYRIYPKLQITGRAQLRAALGSEAVT
jgi:DNA-binding CsgD family transcriptional regulator